MTIRRRYFALAGATALAGGLALSTAPMASAATSVTATTQITGRPDSSASTQIPSLSGNWATDDMTRTATVTLVGSHSGAECGGISPCYQYTGSVQDTSGTFTALSGAVSPNAGDPLVSPPVKGTFAGGQPDFTFYADSNVPASRLPDSASGTSPIGTTSWLTLMFPAGTHFAGTNPSTSAVGDTNVSDGILLPTWSWTYKDVFCEQWVDAFNNGDGGQPADGDITGADHCTDTVAVTNPGSQSWTAGTPVSLQIHASSTDPNVTLSYAASGLPAGLSINASTGLISGTPTAASSFTATVTATSSRSHADSASFAWTVQAATVPPPSTVVVGPGEISTFLNHSASCLDNSGFRWVAGNPLQIWACGAAGGQDQQFELFTKDGVTQLRAIAPAGKPQGPWCVTAPSGTGRLTIQSCDSTNASQHVAKQGSKYVFTGDGGDVMDVKGANPANGTAVIAYPANGGKNQQWSLP